MLINPTAVVFVALTTTVGALAGRPLIGLAVGLAVVLAAELSDRR